MSKLQKATDFIIKLALAEDVGHGDITTRAIIPPEMKSQARIVAKEEGVIAGLEVAAEVFKHLDPQIKFSPRAKDGNKVKKGKVLALLSGHTRAILAGERVALNFLQHLSGIATLTAQYAKCVKRRACRQAGNTPKVKILDTRKTIPGMRLLEKYAVRIGGGNNHRMGLYDAILIKDNHIKAAGGIKAAVEAIRRHYKESGTIEVEAKTLSEVKDAMVAGVDRILLDNMSIKTMQQAVKLGKKAKIKTEASGGINLNNIQAIARAGVDYISIGALTHSAQALDISLKII
jgi:nicotinate-nucleotide pyrophosphorylase (carboxylating)